MKATIGEIILFSTQVLEIFDAQSITNSISDYSRVGHNLFRITKNVNNVEKAQMIYNFLFFLTNNQKLFKHNQYTVFPQIKLRAQIMALLGVDINKKMVYFKYKTTKKNEGGQTPGGC